MGRSGNQTGGTNSPIIAQGRVILCTESNKHDVPEALLDLDTGTVAAGEKSDLEYVESVGSMPFDLLEPAYGTWMGPASTVEPGLEGCLRARDKLVNFGSGSIFVGVHFCLLTNEGHVSQIKVEQLHPLGYETLQINFVTWNNVVATPMR